MDHKLTVEGTGVCECHVKVVCTCGWYSDSLKRPAPMDVWRVEQRHRFDVYLAGRTPDPVHHPKPVEP